MQHKLNSIQKKWIDENPYDFSEMSALFLNCTLKKSPEKSHTEKLMMLSQQIMEAVGVKTEMLRPVDFDIAAGVQPDMTEHGWDKDEGSGGPETEFTNRNTTFLTWNLLHTAKMLKDNGGIPAHGNQRSLWE